MEEEIIFKIQLNTPEAEAGLRSITTATVNLKAENKLLEESIKNLKKAEGDNTKQIVEATAQIELNKNKIKDLNQQQGLLIKTLDAEKGSINQLKAANIALLKERDNISKSTAEGRARIEELNKQYDANTKKINENISDTERQKQGYNTLLDILDKVNPGTKELVTNVGSISKGFTTSIGAINQYGFSLKALGSIPVLQLFTALTTSITAITDLYKSSLPTVEDYRKENEKLTKEYQNQQDALDLLEASSKRQIDLLRAEGKEKEANKIASETAAERLITEQLRVNELAKEYENLQSQLANTPAEYDKLTGTQQVNKAEQDVLKEAIKQVGKELTTQKEIVATVLNEYNILQEQAARLENQESENAKEEKKRQQDELKRLEELRKKRQELIDQRRADTLERAKALKGTGPKTEDELILESYNKLQDQKNEKDKERQDNIDDITKRFLVQQKNRDEKDKKLSEAEIKRRKAEIDIARRKEIEVTSSLTGLSGALQAFGASTKGLDIAIALRNTYKGITEVLSAKSLLPEPAATISKIANTVTVLATGLGAVNQIRAFAGGGLTGTKIQAGMGLPIRRDNGDNMLATVKTGEVILNEKQQERLGGARTFASIGVPGFASGGLASNSLNQIARQAEMSTFNERLLSRMENVQIVLPVDSLELKQSQRNSIKRKSVILQ